MHFLSPELGFHSHTLLPPLVVRDGATALTRWLLRHGGVVCARVVIVQVPWWLRDDAAMEVMESGAQRWFYSRSRLRGEDDGGIIAFASCSRRERRLKMVQVLGCFTANCVEMRWWLALVIRLLRSDAGSCDGRS